jgi:NADP-dependent aldehyde dehydrogenase
MDPTTDRLLPRLITTTAATFREAAELREELFGPASVLVRCADLDEMVATLATVPGTLTVTVHAEPSDHPWLAIHLAQLTAMAGRLVYNGFPTGVRVGRATMHGGPYPATSDPRFTSVGVEAVRRWQRRVCWQDWPQGLLPAALAEARPSRPERSSTNVGAQPPSDRNGPQ